MDGGASPYCSPKAEPVISLVPLIILSRKQIQEKYLSDQRQKYLLLTSPLPESQVFSPAPRDLMVVSPVYHVSTSCPLGQILLEVKKQWGLPIDNGIYTKIGPHFYNFHAFNYYQCYDRIPLNKIRPEATVQYHSLIQRLFIFRYLFALSLDLKNLYAVPKVEGGVTTIIGIYSGNEAQPFGLKAGKINSGVPQNIVERKNWGFTNKILRNYFAGRLPREVLAEWWGITPENYNDKLDRLYYWLNRLTEYLPQYRDLAFHVHSRAQKLLS